MLSTTESLPLEIFIFAGSICAMCLTGRIEITVPLVSPAEFDDTAICILLFVKLDGAIASEGLKRRPG